MFLTPQDFSGKFELHTGMFDTNKLQDYIDKYEKQYLIQLFGATLFDEFISDLSATYAVESPNFIKIFDDFHEDVNFQILMSEGILVMLKGFIYFEYSKDQMNQQTPFGNVSQLSENSKKVTTLNSMMFTRYNESVATYNAIRRFLLLNSNQKIGQVVQISTINNFGTGYSSGIATLNQVGQVATAIIVNAGTGYVSASNVATIPQFGASGLTLNVVAVAGLITSVSIANGGTLYAVGDIVTITGGANNATIQITNVTNTNVGSGCDINITANGINGVGTFTLGGGGTTYTTQTNVSTTGGVGSGCKVNIVANSAGVVTSMTIFNTGSSYAVGNVLTIVGGSATFTITSLTNGQVTGVSVAEDGISYVVGQIFAINGGNNGARISLVKVGLGKYWTYHGLLKSFSYWI